MSTILGTKPWELGMITWHSSARLSSWLNLWTSDSKYMQVHVPWESDVFDFFWCFCIVPWFSHHFPMIFPWFSHNFPISSLPFPLWFQGIHQTSVRIPRSAPSTPSLTGIKAIFLRAAVGSSPYRVLPWSVRYSKILCYMDVNESLIVCLMDVNGRNPRFLDLLMIFWPYLVGGLEHDWIMTFHILGISSPQRTNSYFSEG